MDFKLLLNCSIKSNIHKRHIHSLTNKAFINGKWIVSEDDKSFGVLNPASQKIIGQVPDLSVEQVAYGIEKAKISFDKWKNTTGKERARYLRKIHDLLIKHKDYLMDIITQENGKTHRESLAEVESAISYFDWFSSEAFKITGDILQNSNQKSLHVHKIPLGVCAFITPWNFPLSMLARKIAPSLAAGCTCVVKPSDQTPFSALALAKISLEADLPAGVLNIVTSSGKKTPNFGMMLCCHPAISKVSFTGSTATGKTLLSHCATGVKRTSMELGGNAPFIIFPSADLESAVDGVLASRFRCAGQTCVCANRLIVHTDIYDTVLNLLKERISKLNVGPGNDPAINMGPLINKEAADRVESLIADACSKGGEIVTGGERMGDTFIRPTLIQNINPDMRIWSEEIFGPVLPVIKFDDESQAIAIANDTIYGLAAYFYSNDEGQIHRVQSALDFGMIGINAGHVSCVEAPFEGRKQSGFGVEGSKYGISQYLAHKVVSRNYYVNA